MSVDFPPTEDASRAEAVVQRVRELIQQESDGKDIEKIELNLIQFIPQELAKTKTFTWTSSELKLVLPPPTTPSS